MLSPAELELLKDRGFAIPKSGTDPSVLRRLEEVFHSSRDSLTHYSGWSYVGIFRKSDEYLRFIRETQVITIARQLLGDEIDLYWDSVATKPAFEGKEFSWHQDSGYTTTAPLEYFTFWIPFQDTTQENGCLWVLPGSHRQGVLKHVSVRASADTYPGKKIENFDGSGEVPIEMSAGQILVFSSLLAHRSGPNRSARPRAALAFALHKRGYIELELSSKLAPVPGLPIC